jgi:Alr-MurF fusion protein
MNYSLEDIGRIVKGFSSLHSNPLIQTLLSDSRSFVEPETSLFFALKGLRQDGHMFVLDLYSRGVRNFVIDHQLPEFKDLEEANFIIVPDTLKALQALNAYHRKKFTIPILGITGSNGKTIVKEWLFQLLKKELHIVRSPKSFNSQLGVPLSVWLLNESHELGIFEAGISKVGEMEKLKEIIQPTVGIFTNIGDAHQSNFIDYKHKISEKLKLFADCKLLIFCKDHHLIESQITMNPQFEDIKLFSWSRKFPADLQITEVIKFQDKSIISAKYRKQKLSISIPFSDEASIENAIHCWSFMLAVFPEIEIGDRFMNLSTVAMRLELKEGINDCTIINDSYNSDIGSLAIALDFLNQQHQHSKKTLIISDILQSGRDESGLYKSVADLVHNKQISRVIAIGDAIARNAYFFKIPITFFSTTVDFLARLNKDDFQSEAILLKGSRAFEFEKISLALQQKLHTTILEINLNAIIHNLNYYRSLLKSPTKIMAMVKAFSYGSGTYEIANVLQYHKVDYLGVAFVDEGVALRKAGITIPIMVMNPDPQGFEAMIEYHLEPEIYSISILNDFYQSALRFSIEHYPIHLKLESGMNRLGFAEQDLEPLVLQLRTMRSLSVRSVFSHLAASDDVQLDSFTNEQFERFDSMCRFLHENLDTPFIRHILNSSGIQRFPSKQYEMVRLGIGLYGIDPHSKDHLQQVSRLKTRISQIKLVPKNETVGYGRKGILQRDSRIGIIPVGYSDGLDRKLSNGVGRVIVNHQIAPIIGNVCMDMCMIDLTDIQASEGEEVLIFGEENPITEMARILDTIPYEIMTSISKRVKRVYLME